jgi:L-lactate dehydrogenase (cytochrome)
MAAVSIEDLRLAAKRRLPRAIFEFIDGGAHDEATLRANRQDFEKLVFQPRYMVDVSQRNLKTTVFGQELSAPIIVAPTGMVGIARRKAELLSAVAAEKAGVGFCLSCMASVSVDEVAAARKTPFWYQLYVLRDRSACEKMLARARAAGCTVLLVTVDVPVPGQRDRDTRNGFTVPPRITARNAIDMLRRWNWLADVAMGPRPSFANVAPLVSNGADLTTITRFIGDQLEPSFSWKDFDWLRKVWGGPIAIKGVLAPEDARRAVDCGADGIVVSNHGGRQLEGAVSSIAALPAVADAVGGRLEILLDSGVRRGTDVIKALALGAKAVLIGRAHVYGVAAAGEAGAAEAIRILKGELDSSLALLGWPDVQKLDRSVFVGGEPGRNAPPAGLPLAS